jgi:hypothetical protein
MSGNMDVDLTMRLLKAFGEYVTIKASNVGEMTRLLKALRATSQADVALFITRIDQNPSFEGSGSLYMRLHPQLKITDGTHFEEVLIPFIVPDGAEMAESMLVVPWKAKWILYRKGEHNLFDNIVTLSSKNTLAVTMESIFKGTAPFQDDGSDVVDEDGVRFVISSVEGSVSAFDLTATADVPSKKVKKDMVFRVKRVAEALACRMDQ